MGSQLTGPAVPPLAPLRRTLAALTSAGFAPVVGGSALLVALGVADEARDWDVVVDGDPEAVLDALTAAAIPVRRVPATERLVSGALVVADHGATAIDVIVDFAVRAADGRIVRIPARPGIPWRGLPMARAEDWVAAYAAMGRPERVAALRRAPADRSAG